MQPEREPMRKSLGELAALVGGEVVGDASIMVEGIASIELAGPCEITFLSNPRYAEQLKSSKAGAVIVAREDLGGDKPKLVVPNPYVAYAQVATLFHPLAPPPRGLAPEAFVHPQVKIGQDVSIYPLVWVDRGATLGDRVVLFPGVFVGEDCVIDEDTIIYPGVVLYPRCQLGKRVIVHAGSVIGSDGFGYARDGAKSIKIPQLGIVRIDDDVEIGANNTIDRASFGMTWIQRGVKTDNLVQIGHNVVIGEDSILTGQVGIAGSSKLGRSVILGGQAGIADHIHLGDGVMVGPQAGVAQDVPARTIVTGTPAIPHRVWLRTTPVIPRLPELLKRIRMLEKKLAVLENEIHDREGA
jgi:UDP-3-O-[3-hydroxymyristoyl] glucosamine N-acyltransferase